MQVGPGKMTIEVRIHEKSVERPGHTVSEQVKTFDAWETNVGGGLVSRNAYCMSFKDGRNMTATFWMNPTAANLYDACLASAFATVDGAQVHHNYTITRLTGS